METATHSTKDGSNHDHFVWIRSKSATNQFLTQFNPSNSTLNILNCLFDWKAVRVSMVLCVLLLLLFSQVSCLFQETVRLDDFAPYYERLLVGKRKYVIDVFARSNQPYSAYILTSSQHRSWLDDTSVPPSSPDSHATLLLENSFTDISFTHSTATDHYVIIYRDISTPSVEIDVSTSVFLDVNYYWLYLLMIGGFAVIGIAIAIVVCCVVKRVKAKKAEKVRRMASGGGKTVKKVVVRKKKPPKKKPPVHHHHATHHGHGGHGGHGARASNHGHSQHAQAHARRTRHLRRNSFGSSYDLHASLRSREHIRRTDHAIQRALHRPDRQPRIRMADEAAELDAIEAHARQARESGRGRQGQDNMGMGFVPGLGEMAPTAPEFDLDVPQFNPEMQKGML